jgi:hypothetical protein
VVDNIRSSLGSHGSVLVKGERGASFGFLITLMAVLEGKVSRRAGKRQEGRGGNCVGGLSGLLAFCSHQNGLSGIERD